MIFYWNSRRFHRFCTKFWKKNYWFTELSIKLKVRSEVESTTFKAKDTKKSGAKEWLLEDRPSRGQGQKRSRTKDTRRNCSRKKGSPNFFSGDLKKKVFALKDVEFPQKIRRSPKQKSSQIFCEVSAVFQGKVNRRSWQKCCYRADSGGQ